MNTGKVLHGAWYDHMVVRGLVPPPPSPEPLSSAPGFCPSSSLSAPLCSLRTPQHPGLCQSQAGSRQCVPWAGKESQREQEEVETLALKCGFFLSRFPSHAPRGLGGLGVGGRGRAPKNRQSQLFPGGLGVRPPPRSICLSHSLCHPACQPSPAQPCPAGWDPRPCQPWPT